MSLILQPIHIKVIEEQAFDKYFDAAQMANGGMAKTLKVIVSFTPDATHSWNSGLYLRICKIQPGYDDI